MKTKKAVACAFDQVSRALIRVFAGAAVIGRLVNIARPHGCRRYDQRMHNQVPVHVGYPMPRKRDESSESDNYWSGMPHLPLGRGQYRRSALDRVTIAWERHEVDARWVGHETADCVAALQPSIYHSSGGGERDRFLAGAASRGETALVVNMIGFSLDDKTRSVFGSDDSVDVGEERHHALVVGARLPARTRVELARGLDPTDSDLGRRLLNRPKEGPWWGLKLHGVTEQPGDGGPSRTYEPEGELHPILVDPLGTPVVAMWLAPDGQSRWYVVPDDIDWDVVLDWLVHQALPAYAPQAMRRLRTSSFVDPDLRTPTEVDAQQALADFEKRYEEEKEVLEAAVARARQEADPIRRGLFHGTGGELVRAVEAVLIAAGFAVVDLDVELGGTVSADLLVTFGSFRRLVEVKSQGGTASESLVDSLLKHLRTWPKLRPDLPVGGGVLVVSHQQRQPPDQRSRTVYKRREFLESLTVPVVEVRELFEAWKKSDWTTIQRAVLGATPPADEHESVAATTSALQQELPADCSPPRGRWRLFRRRT